MTKLKIEAVAVLNEEKQEFFTELMKKGVDAIKPEMDKQLNKMTNLEKAKKLEKEYHKNNIVILDDNEISLSKYAEEYPENFKKISDSGK